MDEPWRLDELAHAGAEHLDSGFAAGYDRKQGDVPDISAQQDLAVLRGLGVGPDSTVIDLGAGTGRFVVAIAPYVRRVIAVDVSPPMLVQLRERLAETGLTDGSVEVVEAGLLSYEHTAPPIDAVHTRNALHQLPDAFKAIALARIAQMLRRGGVLRLRDLVYDTTPDRFEQLLETWFADAVDDPAQGYTSADLAEHVRTEFSTFTWLLEPMLHVAGFDVIDRDVHRGVYATYTCLRR
ncbi:MAG: methyltransferase domain-containing protein [Phycisphaeraceae bacterium]